MKLNELNKIEEAMFAGLRGLASGQGKYQTQVQDLFIKDFVQDAITSLKNGLDGGLITLDKQPATNAPQQSAPTTAAPAAPQAPGVQKMTPAQMTTARSQNKIAPGTATGTGPTKRLTPRDRLMLQRQAKAVKEDAYDKMNRVFESIINIDEADGDKMSISDYLMTWFGHYMQGTVWEPKKALITTKLDKIQKDYPNNLKANLQDLARFALALSKTTIPAGAPQEFAQARKQGAAAEQTTIQDLKAALDDFAKTNPAGYNAFIKSLRPVTGA